MAGLVGGIFEPAGDEELFLPRNGASESRSYEPCGFTQLSYAAEHSAAC